MNAEQCAPIKVFVVEDSAPVRARLVEMLFRNKAVRVVGEADSPAAAIDGIRRTDPHAVILDMHLNGGSGIQVLRSLRPSVPQAVFVVLTNHPDERYRAVCMSEGASYFLDKTTEFARVREIIAGLGDPQTAQYGRTT